VPDAVVEGNDDIDDDYQEDDYDEDASYAPDVDADAAAVLLGSSRRRRRRGEEEEDEGEDLMDDAMKDYQPIAALDTYGREGIDDRDYDGMDVDERREVERVLAERDRERRRLVLLFGLYAVCLTLSLLDDNVIGQNRLVSHSLCLI
jgi:hypothetical protein